MGDVNRYIVGLAGNPGAGREEVAAVLANLEGWSRWGFGDEAFEILKETDPIVMDERLPGGISFLSEISNPRSAGYSDLDRMIDRMRKRYAFTRLWEERVREHDQHIVCPDVDSEDACAAVYAAGGRVVRVLGGAGKEQGGLVSGETGIPFGGDATMAAEHILDHIEFIPELEAA